MNFGRSKLVELLRTHVLNRFGKRSEESQEASELGAEQPAFEMSQGEVVSLLCSGASSRFILLVGAQGSGKSTLAKLLRESGKFNRLSMDKVLKHDPLLAYQPEMLIDRFYELLQAALDRRENICDDNLNCKRSARSKTLRRVREAGYKDVVVVHLDMPLEHCLSQNRTRLKEAPDEVVRKIWQQLQQEPVHKPKVGQLIILRPGSSEGRFLVSSVA
jgi:predicted kinase